MRTLFWFGGLGVVAVGLFYLASSQEPKHHTQTLGHTAPSVLSEECLSARLHGLSCISAPTMTEGTCPTGMPPQIIDVCQPVQNWTYIVEPAELIPANAEEPVQGTGSVLFGAGINSDAGVTGGIVLSERNFDAEEIAMPQVAEELPMPCVVLHDDVAEAEELPMPRCDEECSEAKDETECPFFQFWMGVFGKLDPADEAVAAEEIAAPMEEAQEEPACEEDPHRSEHYPHCPYMGGQSCPSYYPSSVPPSRRCGDGEECEPNAESPPQPGVDTMEFRPSDAKDGEFEAKPM